MEPTALADPATCKLVETLLAHGQVQARKRWALLQLTLWHESGWVFPLAQQGLYQLTPKGRIALQQMLTRFRLQSEPDAEYKLQSLALELPDRVHRQVLAAVLRGSRQHRWQASELAELASEGTLATQDGLLRVRGTVPFTLFFEQGRLLDAKDALELLGELILPESALTRLNKVLWLEPPRQIITVESRAALVSMRPAPGQLLLFTPPEHTCLAESFIHKLTPNFIWAHLGDLHPQALARQQQLAQRLERPLRLLLPGHLAAFAQNYGQKLSADEQWQPGALPTGLQLILEPLISRQCWLEHEALVLFLGDQIFPA